MKKPTLLEKTSLGQAGESKPLAQQEQSGIPITAQVSHYNLHRFLEAQTLDYARALSELREGRKRTHWIWYIFPQQKGLGRSYNSQFYGLDGAAEAKAYVEHPILGERLRGCCKALLLHKGEDIRNIMGSWIDVRKLKTSMTLFDSVSPDDAFREVLEAFFSTNGEVQRYG